MHIEPFKLERFFALHEFNTRWLLSVSDPESLAMAELLAMASPESRGLWEHLQLGYTESQGHPRLRSEIADLYQHISPENVLVAAPEELIFIAMQTLLSPGDHVVCVAPAYQSLYAVAQALGCRVSLWEARPEANGWSFDLQELADLLTPLTRLLVINFPHNPTGHLLPRADFDAIIALARRHGIIVFSDEIYRLLEYDPTVRLPAVCDVYERGISLAGLSKAFAAPGLRTGWLAAQERAWMAQWQMFRDYTTICSSAPGEALAIIALENRDAILQRNLDIILENVALAERFFARQAGRFTWRRPVGGSVSFVEWLGGDVESFCDALLVQAGVLLAPGSAFEHTGNFFRLGLGRRNFGEGLAQAADFLANH